MELEMRRITRSGPIVIPVGTSFALIPCLFGDQVSPLKRFFFRVVQKIKGPKWADVQIGRMDVNIMWVGVYVDYTVDL